jgi:uncharacterized membrane protein YgdD (TMEM256/DUF423 family)
MTILAMLGGLVFLVGWIWLVVVSFKVGGALWGILNIFIQPLGGLIFCIVKKAGWQQFIIMVIGLVICWGFGGAALLSSGKY